MSVPATKKLWQGIAISFAIVFAYATVLVKLFHDWWTDENYSHGLLIPFIIGYILWTQRERLARVPVKSSTFLGGAAVIAGLFGLWAGVAGAELYTQRLSLLLLLVGALAAIWFASRPPALKQFWEPFVKSSEPVLFCIADQSQYSTIRLRDAADPQREITLSDSMVTIIIDDVSPLVNVAGFALHEIH